MKQEEEEGYWKKEIMSIQKWFRDRFERNNECWEIIVIVIKIHLSYKYDTDLFMDSSKLKSEEGGGGGGGGGGVFLGLEIDLKEN